jgi:uncharacterized protein (UPF0371 family)
MGVNMAGNCIVDDEVCREASRKEIVRRYFKCLCSLPVIMITSRTADKHRNYALEIGANHYLGKPYDEVELLDLVAGYTRARRQH